MYYSHVFAAGAAFASVAVAIPMKSTQQSWQQKYSIAQVETGRMIPRSGAVAYQQALAKYNATIPANVRTAVAAAQSGTVSANPTQYDSEYLSPVSVGGQTLMLDFDTGSADLWVFSSELPSSEVNGQAVYTPSKSSTSSEESGETWDISYGDGSGASGNVYADTVVIGGVTATAQAVEAATSVSSEFSSGTGDGLVGFAFSSINTVSPNPAKTFFDNVMSSLPQPLFAVTLKYESPGTYDFGFIDSSKYTGSLTYTAVDNSQGFWGFTADGYSVGGAATSSSMSAIADTGTSLILVSDDVVSAYYAKVSGATNSNSAGGYVFDCSTTPPDFGLTVGGATFTVPGKYINYAPNGDGTCYGGIQSSSGIGFNIFGDVFLKAQYVVFDAGNTQLGFAQQAGVSTSNDTVTLLKPRFTQRLDYSLLEKHEKKNKH